MTDERRKFERLQIPEVAKVQVNLPDGKKLGMLSVLGRGGFQVRTKKSFQMGDVHSLVIVDKTENIKRPVRAMVRSVDPPGLVGFEFESLEPDAAVEIGVIIGKYYSAAFNE